MLKNDFVYRDASGNEGTEEENWRSSLNRPSGLETETSETEKQSSQKRKHLSSISQAKHIKTGGLPTCLEDNISPEYDDDFSDYNVTVHSQEFNCDSSFSFSTLDILNSDDPSVEEGSDIGDSKIIKTFDSPETSAGHESRGRSVERNLASPYTFLTEDPFHQDYYLNVKGSSTRSSTQSTSRGISSPVVFEKSEVCAVSPFIQTTNNTLRPDYRTTPVYPSQKSDFTKGLWKRRSDSSIIYSKNEQRKTLSQNNSAIAQPVSGENSDVGLGRIHPNSAVPFRSPASYNEESSPLLFMKQLQQQQQKRVSAVLKNVNSRHKFETSESSDSPNGNYDNNCVGVSVYEPPKRMSPSQVTETPVFNSQCLTDNTGSAERTTLHPSTYAQTFYYKHKLPHDCLERNKFYVNSNLRHCLSNSYDNLSDTDSNFSFGSSSTLSPPKRYQRRSFPLTKTASSDAALFDFRSKFQKCALWYNLEKLYSMNTSEKIIDTHCHLDFLFQKENHKGTFSAYKEKNQKDFLSCFGGCVANFIEPFFFTKRSNWEDLLKEEDIWASFGVHPHFCYRYDEAVEEVLLEALKHEKVVAVGEIGLDYSSRNNCNKSLQQQIFRRQLSIAVKNKKPLIIHCRDAQEDCLRILTEMVPQDTKIHRHCFTGNWIEAKEWLDKFPNLYLGFTSLVTFKTVGYLHEVVRLTPTDRMLFETDAPYFVPSQVAVGLNASGSKDRRFSHPGMVIHVAAQIATLKGITDFPEFLATVRANTKNMYNI